jgi:hypothetical protein
VISLELNGLSTTVQLPVLLGVGVGVDVVGVGVDVIGVVVEPLPPPPPPPLSQEITANVNDNVRMSENASVVVFKNLARKIWGGGGGDQCLLVMRHAPCHFIVH